MGWDWEYRYEAETVEGFVQQLAVSYLKNHYWFYVLGEVPSGKDARAVDDKLICRYGIGRSKWAKARSAKKGEAKIQYLRYRSTFLLLATHGRHEFYAAETGNVRDVRESPIRFYGYSIGYKDGHPYVRIATEQYRSLVEAFLTSALTATADGLAGEFRSLPFEPYGPVKVQLRRLLIRVNELRRTAGLPRVDRECLRTKRKTIKPFGDGGRAPPGQKVLFGWDAV